MKLIQSASAFVPSCFMRSASSQTFVLIWSRLSFFHSFSFLVLCYLCVLLFLFSTGLGPTKMRGASWWEKGIARAIEFGTSHYFVPCDSLFSRLNVGPPFSIELNFDACVFICCSCIEFPLFPDFQFPTWARFRRVSAHLDVFSIQELRHFADFLSLACFSFP